LAERVGARYTSRVPSLLRRIAILLVLSAGSAAPAAAQVVVLEVRVVLTDSTPIPLTGVTLRTLPDTAVFRTGATAADGRVRFGGIPVGRYRITAERIGYEEVERDVDVSGTGLVRVVLLTRERPVGLPGVAVEAQRARTRFEESAGASVAELTQRDLKMLPGLAEADVIRAVEILPGVVSTSDFSSSFNVRGGSADQNLILLDGLPIYNPFHLGGLFSVFNSDMVARAELLAGGFPAQYGGRVSSVLSIESDAGAGDFDVHAGVSVLATRVAVGAELPDGLASSAGLSSGRVRVSARRSYFDQLLRPFFDFPYHLTDLQLYGEGWTENGGRVTITGYTGRDVLDLVGADSFPLQVRWDWGNSALGASWQLPVGAGRTLSLRAGHTRFSTGIGFPEFDDTEIRSRIHQSLARADLTLPVRGAELGIGAALDRLDYDNLAQSAGTVFGQGAAQGWLLGGYTQARLTPGDWILEAGVRTDAWLPNGGSGRTVVQPRLAAKRFIGGRDFAVRAAVGRYAQFMHSLRDEELPLGIDVWVLSGARAPVVVSDQVQTGIEGFAGAWYGSLEGYYRWFDGVAANNPAEDPNDPLDDLVAGTGQSYGADLHIRREEGRIRPMLAVSWLKAWREFPDRATGVEPAPLIRYAPVFDRRLDVDLVVQAMVRDYEIGIRWNVGTGLPYTRPLGGYAYYDYSTQDGQWRLPQAADSTDIAVVLGPRNGERYPLYHRLDVGVRRTFVKGWGTLTPYLDVLNVYNRRNVLFYFYQYDRIPATRAGLSMFPVLPTAGLEVTF
jgi:hypothetical protein